MSPFYHGFVPKSDDNAAMEYSFWDVCFDANR